MNRATGNRRPRVSVALATYNGERYLSAQIESILGQDLSDFELIVSDDCSTDRGMDILRQYKKDRRIRVVMNRSRVGPAANFERSMAHCRCDYIALADQDDIWRKDKLRTLLASIGDRDLIYSDARLIDGNGELIAASMRRSMRLPVLEGYPWRELLFYNFVTGCTALIRKSLFMRARPFPQGIIYHDRWLAFEAARGAGIGNVNEALVDYRLHGANHTGIGQFKSARAVLDSLRPEVQNRYFGKLRADSQAWIESSRLDGEQRRMATAAAICYGGAANFLEFLSALWKHRQFLFVTNGWILRRLKLTAYAMMWPLRQSA